MHAALRVNCVMALDLASLPPIPEPDEQPGVARYKLAIRMHAAPELHPLLGPLCQEEMDRYTGTVVREGNRVLFLPSGRASYEQRWALIEGANRSIDLVSFSMMRDATTRQLRDLLLKKLKQGVLVRVIVDDAVTYSTFVGGYLKQLVRAGAEVIRYHLIFKRMWPDLSAGHPFKAFARILKFKLKRHFHEKYTIVDGTYCILGGINWGNKYAFGGLKPKAWRDSDVLLSGPVVADIERQFVNDFAFYTAMNRAWRNPKVDFDRLGELAQAERVVEAFRSQEAYFPTLAPTGAERVRYLPHKPYDEERLRSTEAVILLLRQAQRYIYWGCHGIRPPHILAETLAAAVERGVEVRLITNSRHSSRTLMFFGLLGWMYWESSNHFPWLLERGIRIFEWQKPGAFHSKNLVIDDVVASVGSYNIASGSTLHHTESNVVVYGGEFPTAVRKQFEVDFVDTKEVTLQTARKIPPRHQPMLRPLHERNLLLPRELRTESINIALDEGRYKRM